MHGMSMMPVLPDTASAHFGEAPFALRYEDICSDGRMMTMAMPAGIGVLWRSCVDALPIMRLRSEGIVPILAQLWTQGSEEPIDVSKPVLCRGHALLAHTTDEAGEITRLLLDMRVRLFGIRGRVFGAPPSGAGEEVLVGEVYARHVFTRPFASRHQRRVTSFDCKGLPRIPESKVAWCAHEDFAALPTLAKALDEAPVDDPAKIAFALHHCDSNQHVNSLVFPRLFEDVCQRRFAERALPTNKLSRELAISYRKPFFGGNQARIALQSYQQGSELGALGGFLPFAEPEASPHCLVRMHFR
jgi:hypothetical protein